MVIGRKDVCYWFFLVQLLLESRSPRQCCLKEICDDGGVLKYKLSNIVATNCMQLLSTKNLANVTEKLNIRFYLILMHLDVNLNIHSLIQLVATILEIQPKVCMLWYVEYNVLFSSNSQKHSKDQNKMILSIFIWSKI